MDDTYHPNIGLYDFLCAHVDANSAAFEITPENTAELIMRTFNMHKARGIVGGTYSFPVPTGKSGFEEKTV